MDNRANSLIGPILFCTEAEKYVIITKVYGERSQVVKAPGCGPGIRGFKSHRSPLLIVLNKFMVLNGFNNIKPLQVR